VALDYSAFDQTMSAQVSTAVSGCIIRVMRQLGCSDEHILIVRGILTDINYPNLHFFGTILQLANSDPSGNPITTELNGGVNSIYLRIFFFRIYNELKGKISYREAIKTMTYGDDNINSVPKKYDRFNGTNIVAEGKKCGLTITMADKDADITDFTNLHESDFLKRKFRYCPDLKHIRAPLAKESITKSLYFMKIDSPEPPSILFAQNVDGALRKISQHGKQDFDEMRQKLLTIANKHDVTQLCKWWTYDELIDHDRKNYYDHYQGHSIADVGDNGAIESDFVSESFVIPEKSKPDFTRIFTIIAEIFLALIPFVKAGRFSDIRMTLRGYYATLSLFTCAHYFMPENLIGGDKARWLNLGHKLRSTFVDLWITQENDIIRPQPYCIVLEGPAGTGKTTCALALVKELFKNKGGIKRSEIVVLNEDDDFQSEFRTHHRVVIFDDVVNTNYKILTGNPLRRLIDFVNNVPKRALSPEADLKGAIKIQPELIMVTTNVHGLGAYFLSNCMDSIYRRAEFLQVANKPNHVFSTDKLDVYGWILSKIPKVTSCSNSLDQITPKYDNIIQLDKPEKAFSSFYEAAKYYRENFEKHTENQNKLVSLVNDYFKDNNQFVSECWEGDIAWNLRELSGSFSIEEMKNILIDVAIEQAQSGKYDELPRAFQQIPNPQTRFEYWWYQFKLIFGFMDFKSETLSFPQRATLKRYFAISRTDGPMIIGMNFCALLSGERLDQFYFFNAEGVKEARPLCGLVDIDRAFFIFEGYDGYITEEECRNLRLELLDFQEEPEFRSETKVFDKEAQEMSKEKLIDFVLADAEFMKYFVSEHVDGFIYQHYLFLQERHKRINYQEREKVNNINKALKSLEQPDLFEDKCDISSLTSSNISKDHCHSAFNKNKGFSKLLWEGIEIGKCPSPQEANVQEIAHQKMMTKYPNCELVAREITFDGISYDLIYKIDDKYIILEAKEKTLNKCIKQAQIRCHALRGLGIPVAESYAYAANTFRRVM
jgi:DNA polymerase III delta prime subunit